MKSRRKFLATLGATLIGSQTIGHAAAQDRPGGQSYTGGPGGGRLNGFNGPDGYNPAGGSPTSRPNDDGVNTVIRNGGLRRSGNEGPQPAGADIRGGMGGRIVNPNSMPTAGGTGAYQIGGNNNRR